MGIRSWFSRSFVGDGGIYTLGDATPELDKADIYEPKPCEWLGGYYDFPLSTIELSQTLRVNVHHESALRLKTNILTSCYKPHPWLTKLQFQRFVFDYVVFGNGYLELIKNKLGDPLQLQVSPAKYTRRGVGHDYVYLHQLQQPHEYSAGSIFHLIEPDLNQELYGLPTYLSGLKSAILNEAATLFRLRYYKNGCHAGFILHISEPAHQEKAITNIKEALRGSKGVGNFKSILFYNPKGNKDGVKLLPIAEAQAKDELLHVKNLTMRDVLTIHRTPPEIIGIVPENTGGLGKVYDAAQVYYRNELVPIQDRLLELNEWVGEPVIQFDPYIIEQAIDNPQPRPPIDK